MIEVRCADPRQLRYREFLTAGDAYAASLYPAESNHMLDVETLCQPDVYFAGVLFKGRPAGCGAFRQYTDYVEIKRVWIAPQFRGLGLSRMIMDHLEEMARMRGYFTARLETGISQPEALGLYRTIGYRDCLPFGEYKPDPLSIFMEKALR